MSVEIKFDTTVEIDDLAGAPEEVDVKVTAKRLIKDKKLVVVVTIKDSQTGGDIMLESLSNVEQDHLLDRISSEFAELGWGTF